MTRYARFVCAIAVLVPLFLAKAVLAELTLLPPPDMAVSGGPLTLVLLITNDSDRVLQVEVPRELDIRLTHIDEAYNTRLPRQSTDVPDLISLQPGTFRKVRYSGTLPVTSAGAFTVRAHDLQANSLLLAIEAVPRKQPERIIAQRPASAEDSPPSSFLSALSIYEPVYFAAGVRDGRNAKFQLSFKFQFFPPNAPLVEHFDFLQHLYLGYTQTSLWDVHSSSAPFQDSSYKPRLFFYDPLMWEAGNQPVALGLETGLGHESNGKATIESRSIDYAYAKPIVTLGSPKDWHVTIAPMFVQYISRSGNPDIADYRGYVDLEFALQKQDRWRLFGLLRKGDVGYSAEINFAYPLTVVALGNLNGYFLVQYFNGYGESILDYNRRESSQLRFGLLLAP